MDNKSDNKRDCWNCKYYIPSKSILFGLGLTAESCKKNQKLHADTKCIYFDRSYWRTFWNKVFYK